MLLSVDVDEAFGTESASGLLCAYTTLPQKLTPAPIDASVYPLTSDRGIAQGYRARSGARYPGTVNDRLKPQRDALKYSPKACVWRFPFF